MTRHSLSCGGVARFALVAALCFTWRTLSAQSTHAQSDSVSAVLALLVGTELRVRAPTWVARGRLLMLPTPDTMLLQFAHGDSLRQYTVPLPCVTRLERLDGHYSQGRSAFKAGAIGLGFGLVVGGMVRVISGNKGDALAGTVHTSNGTGAVVAIALTSAAVGALIGATKGVDRWTSVPLPTPTPRDAAPSPASCDRFKP
ncbi:MAG TPA: hypothetical protein VIC55_00195 [Gemmatimonadaceae bacterium]|jgi:hypothetical protein